ncbi:hypothetical protein E2C01_015377 [Portunus trituberculatus]|uniref:Uncharacterized protein n=1 Tax=Portunus trituberculatus TaxID=210409 RepID=A0A5B7DMT7_PORTR|nr:hypothetical protein [Portunus trituberculatus]
MIILITGIPCHIYSAYYFCDSIQLQKLMWGLKWCILWLLIF